MAYIVVDNLKSGLDRRGSRVNGEPGSLWEAENVHVNRIGELERRKKFVSKYTLPANTFGLAADPHSDGTTSLHVFGSEAAPAVPAGVDYTRLQHPDGLAMTDVLWVEPFDSKLYAIAEFTGGEVAHFYDGDVVADWLNGVVRTGMTDIDGIAEHLRTLIDAHDSYTAARAASVITVTGAANDAFTVETSTQNVSGGVDDQTLVSSTTQTAVAGVAETLATAAFSVTGGTNSAGVNKVTSITVDGIEVLGAAVDWATSNSATAANIATQVSTYTSSPDYAASAVGQAVTISADAGTGETPNGYTVAIVVAGDVTTDAISTSMAGGVNAVAGQPQITTLTVGGAFEVGDKFNAKIGPTNFGFVGNPDSVGRTALTFKTKLYSTVGSITYFCGVDSPAHWDRDDLSNPGSNFINVASQSDGAQNLMVVQPYQGNLAFFAEKNIQVWSIDADEDNNVLLQTLRRTGTVASKSAVAYGDNDVFYLSNSGIRSIRARDSSNAAFVNDVGTKIDTLVQDHLDTLTDTQIENAVGALEPRDARYWLSIGKYIYVFSYFPGSKISAWSRYDVTDDIGASGVEQFAIKDDRVYARAGDTIYLYGGDDDNTYPDDNEILCTVSLPFLDGKTPGTVKNFEGFDVALTGQWAVDLLVNPSDETKFISVGTIAETTYPDGRMPAVHSTTHVAPKLVCSKAGPATISNLVIHYEDLNSAG